MQAAEQNHILRLDMRVKFARTSCPRGADRQPDQLCPSLPTRRHGQTRPHQMLRAASWIRTVPTASGILADGDQWQGVFVNRIAVMVGEDALFLHKYPVAQRGGPRLHTRIMRRTDAVAQQKSGPGKQLCHECLSFSIGG